MKYIYAIFFCLSLFSCENGIIVEKDLNGLKLEEIIAKYGSPTNEGIINYTNDINLTEMQSNLYSIYTDLKKGDTVVVKQLYWEYKNRDKRVIWFEYKSNDWVVIDNLKWSKEIQF